jgi:hypothetical protein
MDENKEKEEKEKNLRKSRESKEGIEWLITLVETYYHGELPRNLREDMEKGNFNPIIEEAINICVEKKWVHELYDIARGKYNISDEMKDRAGKELVKILSSYERPKEKLMKILEDEKISKKVKDFAEEILFRLESEKIKLMKNKRKEVEIKASKEKEKRKI